MDVGTSESSLQQNGGNENANEADDEPNAPFKKEYNTLTIWGNKTSMNLNNLVLENILQSPYYRNKLSTLKTIHELVDEIYYNVAHLEPWEKGTRKTTGQTGMCGGVRGVGAGGVVSTPFCIMYRLFTLKLTRKQVYTLLNHADSPYIRGIGFMYIRFCLHPATFWDWYERYLEDEEQVDPRAGGGDMITIGQMVKMLLTKLDWYSTLFPRIPVPVQKELDAKMREHEKKIRAEKGLDVEQAANEDLPEETTKTRERSHRDRSRSRDRSRRTSKERHGSKTKNDKNRSKSRSPSKRRKKSRSRSRSRDLRRSSSDKKMSKKRHSRSLSRSNSKSKRSRRDDKEEKSSRSAGGGVDKKERGHKKKHHRHHRRSRSRSHAKSKKRRSKSPSKSSRKRSKSPTTRSKSRKKADKSKDRKKSESESKDIKHDDKETEIQKHPSRSKSKEKTSPAVVEETKEHSSNESCDPEEEQRQSANVNSEKEDSPSTKPDSAAEQDCATNDEDTPQNGEKEEGEVVDEPNDD